MLGVKIDHGLSVNRWSIRSGMNLDMLVFEVLSRRIDHRLYLFARINVIHAVFVGQYCRRTFTATYDCNNRCQEVGENCIAEKVNHAGEAVYQRQQTSNPT